MEKARFGGGSRTREMVLFVLLVATLSAEGVAAVPAAHPSASGSVRAEQGRFGQAPAVLKLDFAARGTDPVTGRVTFEVSDPAVSSPPARFEGIVDVCYRQRGRTVIFGGTITDSANVPDDPAFFQIAVQDGGQRPSAVDLVAGGTLARAPTCSFDLGLVNGYVVTDGGVRVHPAR